MAFPPANATELAALIASTSQPVTDSVLEAAVQATASADQIVPLTPSDTVALATIPKALTVLAAGNLAIKGTNSAVATYIGLAPGTTIPVRARYVMATGTHCDGRGADLMLGLGLSIARVATAALPVMVFSVAPSITTDGTPQVGEIAVLSFGVATRQLGSIRLRKNGADYADASAGSFQWTEAGTYVLRVMIAGTGIFADSAPVVVAAAAVGSLDAPTLANPSDFVAGENPPRPMLMIPATVDKTLVNAVVEWDRQASGAFQSDSSRRVTITDLMGAADNEQFTVTGFNALAAGAIRVRAEFQPKNGDPASSWSPLWADTLNAVVLPAATTTLDPTNKYKLAYLSNGNLDYTADAYDPNNRVVIGTSARSDARFFEVTIVDRGLIKYGGENAYLYFGITGPTYQQDVNDSGLPDITGGGSLSLSNNTGLGVMGDKVVVVVTPASMEGTSDGTFKVYVNGVLYAAATQNHSRASYKFWIGSEHNPQLHLNCGQEAFTFTPPNPAGITLKRWN